MTLCCYLTYTHTHTHFTNVFNTNTNITTHTPPRFCSVAAGVPAEGDAGNALRGHLVGGFHSRFGHRLLAHQGSHVRWHVDRCAVPLQVSHHFSGGAGVENRVFVTIAG